MKKTTVDEPRGDPLGGGASAISTEPGKVVGAMEGSAGGNEVGAATEPHKVVG